MKKISLILLSILCISCAEINEAESPTTPSVILFDLNIEFRVSGNTSVAVIKYVSPAEGTTIITSATPWQARVKTADNNVFLYLEAQDAGTGLVSRTIQAQIIVNGRLFREAVVTGELPLVVVSGTYTR